MMNAFIVRPFGTKTIVDRSGKEIDMDFDRVESELLHPALEKAGVTGGTTAEIVRAGNIREDMFQRLLTADLVIADLSIHNANVFYELGVRHALRDKRTLLVRCAAQDVPFDLRTDRYLRYNVENPAADVDELVRAIDATLESELPDSPVFRLLPGLEASNPEQFHVVPRTFSEFVDRARKNGRVGDLELLGSEILGCPWARSGLRLVGRALTALEADEAARGIWEAVRRQDRDDWEANLKLGTIYARSGDLMRSDQALRRVVDREDLGSRRRSEAYSLLGSNAKTLWIEGWASQNDPADRRKVALASPNLKTAYDEYLKGYLLDLNHYYSGVNVAALATIMVDLASEHAGIWNDGFDSEREATDRLEEVSARREEVLAAVSLVLESERERLRSEDKRDIWLDLTRADLRCLTMDRRTRVARAYREALQGADRAHFRSAGRQLELFEKLGVRTPVVRAALDELETAATKAARRMRTPQKPRFILFTGHRIDDPERKDPRFPPEKEPVAREAIREKVAEEYAQHGDTLIGMAGGASGGDMLFHEVCLEMGIKTRLYLALPKEAYIVRSVQSAGHDWVERFHLLYDRLSLTRDVYLLEGDGELPVWLKDREGYSIWQRNNLWQLYNALAYGGERLTLLALWNGTMGDGPGGTDDMVRQARLRGAKTIVIDTKSLFGIG